MKKTSKNIVIFVNAIRPATFMALDKYESETGKTLRPVVFVDTTIRERILDQNGQNKHLDEVPFLSVDFNSSDSIKHALDKYKKDIVAVVSQYENSMHEFQKLIPHVPYLNMPSVDSITWSTEKKFMREKIGDYDTKLVPEHHEVHELHRTTINDIENKMKYPVIVKPSGLEGSLLVAKANNRQELESNITKSLNHIQEAYDTWIKRQKPFLLIEEFMEGSMYSIDTYVNNLGECTHLPSVLVVTGHDSGQQDFYGYMRLTPSSLSSSEENGARKAVEATVNALGVKSLTIHVELMHTKNGWKIIELGPRIGGYRHDMYFKAYGINHIVNDILNRAGENIILPAHKPLGNSAVFNIYADSEGTIKRLNGIEKIKTLQSFVSVKQNLSVGDKAVYARHNGVAIFEIELFNKVQEKLQKDIDSMESAINIEIA